MPVTKSGAKAALPPSGRGDGVPLLASQAPPRFRADGAGNGVVGQAPRAGEAAPGPWRGAGDRPLLERSGGSRKPSGTRPLREQESARGLAALPTSATVLNAAAKVPGGATREGDSFERCAGRPEGGDGLIPAAQARRLCAAPGPRFARLAGQPPQAPPGASLARAPRA